MAKHTVVTMPGDGIGNQVLPEALRLLKAVGFDAEYIHAEIGWECWRSQGNALPERTVELLAKHKFGLFGAITSKPKKEAEAELEPELQGKGYSYFSPIVTMRQRFNLHTCIRPCISFPGNPLNFIRKRAGGGFEEPLVNIVIFRQNTEGLYAGVEWTNPPDMCAPHSKLIPSSSRSPNTPGPDLAVSVRIITRNAARKIAKAGFEYAKKFGYKSVTICEKPNVLRETSGMMEEEAKSRSQGISGNRAVVDQHRRADDVADEESRRLRRDRGFEPVRRRHLRRFRRTGRRPGLRGLGQHRR